MINLLPEDAKQHFAQDRFSRFLVVFGAMLSLILCVGVLLLWVPWFALSLEEKELDKALYAVTHSPSFLRIDEIESQLSLLNQKLDVYEKNKKNIFLASHLFDRLLGHQGPDISFSFFSYVKEESKEAGFQFQIEGVASSRNALVAFSNRIEADPYISNVRSPLSNFLRERDIAFTLTFDVDPSLLRSEFLQ